MTGPKEERQEMSRRLRASSEAGGPGSGCVRQLRWSRWGAWPVGLSHPGRLAQSKSSLGAELATHGALGIAGTLGTGLGAASWLPSPLVSSGVFAFCSLQ